MLTRTFTNYQKISELTTANEEGPNVFDGNGVAYKCKLIGMEDVSSDRDEQGCLDAIIRLKNGVRVRGEHKQKIQIHLSLDGVKVMDELTKVELACHEITRISLVILDPNDMRAFGYIYNTSDERHQFWAIRTERPAQILVLAFKDLFEESYKHKLSLEDDNEQESNQILPTESSIQSPESLFDDTWSENIPTIESVPLTFENGDPWGFNQPVVSEKQSVPHVTDDPPAPVFLLPPPPPSLSRRMTTTQQPTPTVIGTGDLFSVFNMTPPTSSDNNNVFTLSTQQETNFLNPMPTSSSITSTSETTSTTNSYNQFDMFADFSSQPTSTKPTDEFFFS